MDHTKVKDMSIRELLRLFSEIGDELVARKFSRSASNPTGDYAQKLFQTALELKWTPLFSKGYNATDLSGAKYKIRSRRITETSGAPIFSEAKDISTDEFDWFAIVLFTNRFSVDRALLIPKTVVRQMAKTVEKGYELAITDQDLRRKGIRDVTTELQRAEALIT